MSVIPDEFFTIQSMGTLVGATGATFVVSNGIQKAFDFNPKWLALIIAQIIVAIGVQNATNGKLIDYAIGVINGFLVFASAAGTTAIVGHVIPAPVQLQSVGSNSARRRFLSGWF